MILICSVLFYIVPLLSFVVFFHKVPFSYKSEDWAFFATYLGGTTTSVFSMLTFIGIIYTLKSTIDISENQKYDDKIKQEKDDIFRLIEVIQSDIEKTLTEEVVLDGDVLNVSNKTTTLGAIICDNKLQIDKRRKLLGRHSHAINGIWDLLAELKSKLETYERLSTNNHMTLYYKKYNRQLVKVTSTEAREIIVLDDVSIIDIINYYTC